MRLLFSLLSVFGIEAEAQIDDAKRAVMFSVVVGLFVAITAIFLIIAGYVALSAVLGPLVAALIIAAIAAVLALIVHLSRHIGKARRQRERAARRRDETSTLATTAALTAAPIVLRSGAGRLLSLPLLAALAYFALKSRDDD